MAHSDFQEAADSPVDDMDSAAAAISRHFGGEDIDDETQNDDSAEEPEATDDELEVEGEDEQEDEPDAPAIDAPASLTAEEKAKFAALPKEAQQVLADVEARRASQVQSATTKAAEAQRNAEASAARADAQAKAVYAGQLKAFADHLAPQRPDPMLAQTDPASYIALQAQYDAARAQHDEFVQHVSAMEQEAGTAMTEAETAERDRFLMSLPEVQNEETRSAFFEKAIGAAKNLGLDLNALNAATGQEWKALSEVATWKEKAEKYDAALSRQMQRVREGKKATTARPNAAQPSSSEGRGLKEAKQRARQSGDVNDAAAALRAAGF